MKNNILKGFFIVVIYASFNLNSFAETPMGWRWYNEPKVVKENKEKPKVSNPNNTSLTRTLSSTEQLKWFQTHHQEIQSAATIDPTNNEKVEKAMLLNQYVSDQSSKFGMTFKEVLLSNPSLSYIKDRPVEHASRSDYLQGEKEKKVYAVKEMASQGWGFFFVYNGSDSLSETLAPSIQQFATTYGIDVLGISKDGIPLSSIKNNKLVDKDSNSIQVDYLPALLLVNPSTKEIKPLAYGFISQDQLLGRFFNVASNYNQPDF